MRGLRDEVQLSDGGIIIVNNKINREIFDAVNARAKKSPRGPELRNVSIVSRYLFAFRLAFKHENCFANSKVFMARELFVVNTIVNSQFEYF